MKYGLYCRCHGYKLYDTALERDRHVITFQCNQDWFRVERDR